jgi:hypothetical protein
MVMKRLLVIVVVFMMISSLSHSQTTTVFWSEDFEGAWSDYWFSDLGVWQVGTPSIGPGAAHGGVNCATVGLTSNYPADFTSSFIYNPIITIPDASQNPRLRYWHWWNIGYYDYGRVRIKENGSSTWTNLSPGYGGTGGDDWNYACIDLTPYANKSVQISFFFSANSNGGGAEGPGWYIDDISIITGPINYPFPQTFEDGLGDWYSVFGVWQAGTPVIGPGGAHGGTKCLSVGLNNNYPADFKGYLDSPFFVVPDSAQLPRLRFWHWWSNGFNDYGVVTIHIKDSADWIEISSHYGYSSGNVWSQAFIDLTRYAGKTVQVGFNFIASSVGGGGEGPGWYIDDITLETGPINYPFPESFEAGMGSWYSVFGGWEAGAPTNGPAGAHNGVNCAAVGLHDNYSADLLAYLCSPFFTIPDSAQSPRLRFWHWWNIGYNDYACVTINEKYDTNWVEISPHYSGTGGNAWSYAFIDLTPYAGKTARISFDFHASSVGGGSGGPGWYIDDINIPMDTVSISGGVADPGGTPVNTGTVILFNTTNTYGGYDTADVVTVVNGNFVSRIPAAYPSIVLAMPDPSQISTMLPTYFGEELYWIDADTILVSSSTNIGTIHFISPPPAMTGNATISGHVIGNLMAKANDPIDNVGVIIKKNTGSTTAGYTRTGADGSFSFTNVETGDYTILVDYQGIPMYQLSGDNTVSVSSPDTTVQLTAHVDSAYIRFREPAGIDQDNSDQPAILLVPNPTTGRIRLVMKKCDSDITMIRIFDLQGRVVHTENLSTGFQEEFSKTLDLSGLDKGLYVVSADGLARPRKALLMIE